MTSLADLKNQPPPRAPPTMDAYRQYTAALKSQEERALPTGFLEFAPRDPITQAKYSAMSPMWEGIASSDAAIARGDYSLDSAEKTRQELRSGRPTQASPQPVETSWNCSIQ